MKPNIVFFPLARTTFSMPDAEALFRKSFAILNDLAGEVRCPSELLTSPEMLSDYADSITRADLLVYQCTTFVGGDFVSELTRRFNCPVIVWALDEPSINGTRLKLNSLTGAFSAGNSLHMQGRSYRFIFGSPGNQKVQQAFKRVFSALEMVYKMKELVVGVVGSQPPGFGFGAIDQSLLAGKFGIRTIQVEASGIMRKAATYESKEFTPAIEELKSRTRGWEKMSEENLEKYARLQIAYKDFIDNNGVKSIASRCWPDFFTEYGAPVCSVLSLLNDQDVSAACEADIGGAVSLYIGSQLTGSAAYLGDPVAVDSSCDGIVFWHCGAGATTLSGKKEGPTLGVHPNRKIGPTMEFGLKSGQVTVLRLGMGRKGFRLFAMEGEALDEPQKFYGTSVTVRPKGGNAEGKVGECVRDGWEPHFVVAYGDIMEELELMCGFLDIDFYKY